MESKGKTSWRQHQKYGNQRWRQLNLVFLKVAEKQVDGTHVLSLADAAKAVDMERLSLEMTVDMECSSVEMTKYVKHLESEYQHI